MVLHPDLASKCGGVEREREGYMYMYVYVRWYILQLTWPLFMQNVNMSWRLWVLSAVLITVCHECFPLLCLNVQHQLLIIIHWAALYPSHIHVSITQHMACLHSTELLWLLVASLRLSESGVSHASLMSDADSTDYGGTTHIAYIPSHINSISCLCDHH